MPTMLAFVSQLNRVYLSLIIQPEAIINEVSTVQAIRVRINQWQVHKAKDLPSPTSGTYNFTMAKQLMKVLEIGEPRHMHAIFVNRC